jgi:hypothetical protein
MSRVDGALMSRVESRVCGAVLWLMSRVGGAVCAMAHVSCRRSCGQTKEGFRALQGSN